MTRATATKAATRAYESLKAAILEGTYTLGTRLKEQQLSAHLGVSRTPVREALLQLQTEGLVRGAPNRGMYVAGWSERDLTEIFDLRALLEGNAARSAAVSCTPTTISELARLAEEMAASRGSAFTDATAATVAELNSAFHGTVIRASGNLRLQKLLQQLVEFPLVRRTFQWYTAAELDRSFDSHRELVAALQAHDPEWSEAVMRAHIRAAHAALLRNMRTSAHEAGLNGDSR